MTSHLWAELGGHQWTYQTAWRKSHEIKMLYKELQATEESWELESCSSEKITLNLFPVPNAQLWNHTYSTIIKSYTWEYICKYTYKCNNNWFFFKKKEALNLKEIAQECMRGVRGRKGKGEVLSLTLQSQKQANKNTQSKSWKKNKRKTNLDFKYMTKCQCLKIRWWL